MGCDYYYLGEDYEDFIRFAEDDDDFVCLCTFPHNDENHLTRERLRSLALLGAAVVMAKHGDLITPVFIPHKMPKWLIDEINRLVPEDGMTIDDILDEMEQAYPTEIFPDTTQEERDTIISQCPWFIDRTSAMAGRHLVKVIRSKLGKGDE